MEVRIFTKAFGKVWNVLNSRKQNALNALKTRKRLSSEKNVSDGKRSVSI